MQNPPPDDPFQPDAETRRDAESLDYKHNTAVDPAHQAPAKAGSIAGAIVGAGVGTVVGGLVGTVVGAAVGAITGAVGGKIGGEMFDPSAEFEYWRTHHGEQSFLKEGFDYADYEPAYRTGYDNYAPGETFEQAEPDLKRAYEGNGGQHRLSWEDARPAARAAWDRMTYVFPVEK